MPRRKTVRPRQLTAKDLVLFLLDGDLSTPLYRTGRDGSSIPVTTESLTAGFGFVTLQQSKVDGSTWDSRHVKTVFKNEGFHETEIKALTIG